MRIETGGVIGYTDFALIFKIISALNKVNNNKRCIL